MAFNKKEWLKEYREKWFKTPIGRAWNLVSAYNEADKKGGRGKGDLTAKWIVENIFTKPCAHCGKTGWDVIGCNRLDNSKPHTKDNVEPCCRECNTHYGKKKIYQYTLDDKLVNTYNSFKECETVGFCRSSIYRVIKGLFKQYKGYKWSFEPL